MIVTSTRRYLGVTLAKPGQPKPYQARVKCSSNGIREACRQPNGVADLGAAATSHAVEEERGLWKIGSRRGTSLAPVAFERYTLIASEPLRLFDSTACQTSTATSYKAALSRHGICGTTHCQQRQNVFRLHSFSHVDVTCPSSAPQARGHPKDVCGRQCRANKAAQRQLHAGASLGGRQATRSGLHMRPRWVSFITS